MAVLRSPEIAWRVSDLRERKFEDAAARKGISGTGGGAALSVFLLINLCRKLLGLWKARGVS